MSWFRQLMNRERARYDDELVAAAVIVQLIKEEEESRPRRGSVIGRQVVPRDRLNGHFRLMADYFASNPVYDEDFFRRRFRMTRRMFLDIATAVHQHDDYFVQKYNAANELGFSHLQKVTAALRMLAYGGPADSFDEYLRMGESTILETLRHFVRVIVKIYGPSYLRPPNQEEVTALLQIAEAHGFPGNLGSIDCMHWEWEKCPVALQGQFRGHYRKPTIILEAVASSDLWIWHAFFRLPGSLNDINVLNRSPVFDALASGNAPQVSYTVNEKEYNMGYYLADGIYPEWATLITDIRRPQTHQQILFTCKQHEYRKDLERAFGVLQAQYAICKGPARLWSQEELKYIMDCIVILHNMGIQYERNMNQLSIEDYVGASPIRLDSNRNVPAVRQLIEKHRQIQSRPGHHELKQDLIQHVWARYGSEQEQTEFMYGAFVIVSTCYSFCNSVNMLQLL